MKPIIRLSTFVLLAVTLTACMTPSTSTSVSSEMSIPSIDHSLPPLSSEDGPSESMMLDFYNLNDFHGALAYNPNADEIGINRLAHYFKERQQDNPNSI
jgi:2',3'-cyclic-nucleotide 2'-phosphodiesterase (5'-nucleotidase family)